MPLLMIKGTRDLNPANHKDDCVIHNYAGLCIWCKVQDESQWTEFPDTCFLLDNTRTFINIKLVVNEMHLSPSPKRLCPAVANEILHSYVQTQPWECHAAIGKSL